MHHTSLAEGRNDAEGVHDTSLAVMHRYHNLISEAADMTEQDVLISPTNEPLFRGANQSRESHRPP